MCSTWLSKLLKFVYIFFLQELGKGSRSCLKMKIAVLGATGQTGLQLVSQALQQGHIVTAIVRNPGKMTITNDNLKVIQRIVLYGNCIELKKNKILHNMFPVVSASCDDQPVHCKAIT